MTVLPRLYAIADSSFGDPVQLAQSLIMGGARLIQLRTKNASARELFGQVERVLELAAAGVRIIVNDRVDVARITSATGLHLGQADLAPALARKVLGLDRIIGFSTHNLDQALEADKFPIDYISVGPIFPTSTKQNPDPVVGPEGLAIIAKAVHKPIVAIGGIKLENAAEVLNAGAHSIAVIRDLLDCEDVQRRTREWIDVLNCRGAL
jgi:thiamine-phosphate pyrophosphorylase